MHLRSDIMNQSFLDNFERVSKDVEKLGKTINWVPTKNYTDVVTKNKTKGVIYAWQVSRSTAEFLRFLVVSTSSKTILELGTSIGYSGMWFGLGAKETKGHVYSIEVFKPKIKLAKEHIVSAGLEKQITIFEEDIFSALKKFKKKIDFVFIDAKKEDYHKYYEQVFPKLRLGGIIVADNITNYKKYMTKFLDTVKNDNRIISYPLQIDNGLLLIKKIRN